MKKAASVILILLLTSICLGIGAAEEWTEVFCMEEGFWTKVPAGMTARYTENTGFQVYTGKAGYIPYVIVSRRPAEMKFNNPENYLNNVYREYMENRYGDNMLGTNPARVWEIGGKKLLGARYLYKVDQTTVCQLQLIEQRADGDVEYTAKYIDGEGDRTMAALDLAVQGYRTEAVEAAPSGTVLEPGDLSQVSVDTKGGMYWAKVSDADRIEDGGYFTVSLYLQDTYDASSVEALKPGDRVRVNGQLYTVHAVRPTQDGDLEILPEEETDSYIVLRKLSDYFYNALVDDWTPCTQIGDRKIMLPLANRFMFTALSGDGEAVIYDADGFIQWLTDNPDQLNQYNTMLQFEDELVTMIIHTDYPAGPEEP